MNASFRKRVLAIAAGAVVVLLVLWAVINPPGRFGICAFGFTTYGGVPRPIADIQVRSDGAVRTVGKTHDLRWEHVEWLVDPLPEVLVIGTGWDGVARPDPAIAEKTGCEVRILTTGEAIRLYNRLRKEGRAVAIHVHSTC